jgi:homoserine O-acetyltransferase
MRAIASQWAREFDANTLIVLRAAAVRFDAHPGAANIKKPVLYALSRSDALFPPAIAPDTVALLKKGGADARYVEIDSDYGHRGPGVDWQKWAPQLEAFLDEHCG